MKVSGANAIPRRDQAAEARKMWVMGGPNAVGAKSVVFGSFD